MSKATRREAERQGREERPSRPLLSVRLVGEGGDAAPSEVELRRTFGLSALTATARIQDGER